MTSQWVAPVFGLVLAGGRSTRMQRDKAMLPYHGTTQLEWAMDLLGSHVERVFVSVRPGQTDPVRARFEQIVDTHEGLGPIAGIMAAQARFPDAAWLVVACDLPFLEAATLDFLLAERDPRRRRRRSVPAIPTIRNTTACRNRSVQFTSPPAARPFLRIWPPARTAPANS